jgi:hypothetical protein
MSPRSARLASLVFGLLWLTFGIFSLTDGNAGMGIAQLALGIAWLLVAAFKVMRSATPSEVTANDEDRSPRESVTS